MKGSGFKNYDFRFKNKILFKMQGFYKVLFVGLIAIFLGLVFASRVSTLKSIDNKNLKTYFFKSESLEKVRNLASANISSFLPQKESSLVLGMVLGIDNLEAKFKQDLTKTGTIHAVVVSGQNLTIVAGFFVSLRKLLGRKISLILAAVFCFFYAILTGFQPPVVRAFFMTIATFTALILGRQATPLISLFFVALVMIFIWPSILAEVSFQLTFVATLGIITLGRSLSFKFKNVPILGENAAIAISAYLFTAPLILFYFGRVSLISPIVNILIAETILPTMIFGFLAVIFSFVFMPLGQIFSYFAYFGAFLFSFIVDLFSKIEFGNLAYGKGNVFGMLLIYFLIFAMIYIWTRKPATLNK